MKITEVKKLREIIAENINLSNENKLEQFIDEGLIDNLRSAVSRLMDPLTKPEGETEVINLLHIDKLDNELRKEIEEKIYSSIIILYNLSHEDIMNANNIMKGFYSITDTGKILVKVNNAQSKYTFEELISKASEVKYNYIRQHILTEENEVSSGFWKYSVRYISNDPFYELILSKVNFSIFKEDIKNFMQKQLLIKTKNKEVYFLDRAIANIEDVKIKELIPEILKKKQY